MGNPDLIITIKGWVSNFSFLIKGTEYNSIKVAINKAMELFYKEAAEYERLADRPEDLPAINISDIEIREIFISEENKEGCFSS